MIVDPVYDSSSRPSLPQLLDTLEAALTACAAAPADPEAQAQFDRVRRETAETVAGLRKADVASPQVGRIRSLVRQITECGLLDRATEPDALVQADAWSVAGWPGLLAAMLAAPAWRCPSAPSLADVPGWLWPDYAVWRLGVPGVLDPLAGETEAWSASVLAYLTDLARWSERNIGSASVISAIETWLPLSSLSALHALGLNLRHHAEMRARILSRYFRVPAALSELPPLSRIGRRLRVGFVANDWSRSSATCAALARFEHLSPADFEVVLFSARDAANDSPFAQKCRACAAEFQVLPAVEDEQMTTLQYAALDVLVFPETIASACDTVARLALHRHAPLQIMLGESGATSGFPEIDLCVCGAEDDDRREGFSERLGMLRGPARAFALQPAKNETRLEFSRDNLNLPPDAVLMVTMLSVPSVAKQTLEAWARLLAAAPAARLLAYVVPGPNRLPGGGERLLGALQNALAPAGCDPSRVMVLAPDDATHEENQAVLGLADIHLVAPGAVHEFWLAAAFHAGIPVAGDVGADWNCSPADPVSGADVFGANHEDRAIRLAMSADTRDAFRRHLAGLNENGHGFLDTLAAGDAFGHLLEAAYDELELSGRELFRMSREPLRCGVFTTVDDAVAAGHEALARDDISTALFEAGQALRCAPDSPEARHLFGAASLADGQAKRAVTYLLAAVEQRPDKADYWFALARALVADDQRGEASRALQTCLRLDRSRAEGWLLLVELAEGVGATEIARDAVSALRATNPDHPELAALTGRYPA
ncbi:hypothetical protein OH491_11175 [Termitidicoccus mucosus]|uniref:Uncharacterized protein n=1 Tax=Termitidicoccus mucosus TaxID=1184151 RepID=A0A178IF17_9BACT|nr:hypothetical protein AW736_16190 [Opitutaceae bacterium TSB47]